MHTDGVVVSELPDIAAIAIGDINLLLPAASGDKRDLGPGDSFLSGQGFDDVVCELMRARAHVSAVSFRKHRRATVIDHLSLADFPRSPFPARCRNCQRPRAEVTGEREVVLHHLRRGRAFAAAQRVIARLIWSPLLIVIVGTFSAALNP